MIDLKHEEYYFSTAKKFFQKQEYEKAIPWLEMLLDFKRIDTSTYYMLACSLLQRREEKSIVQAMEYFKMVDERDKEMPCLSDQALQYCRYMLGRDAYYRLYDRKKAYEYFLEARMLDGADSINGRVSYHLARIENFHGNYIEALCYAKEAGEYFQLSNEENKALFEKGFSLYRLGDYQEAKETFLTMLEKDLHMNAARYLAKVYEREGNFSLAIQTLEIARSYPLPEFQDSSPYLTNPLIVSLYEDLGRLLKKDGQIERSNLAYQKAKVLR